MTRSLSIEMLPADYGDAILVSYGDETERHHLMVDGGLVKSYREGWKGRLRELGEADAALDLLVVTHIDADHINGVRAFVEANQKGRTLPALLPIREVWFNQYRHIRAFADDAGKGHVSEGERDLSAAKGATIWPTRQDLIDTISETAPGYARLVERLARAADASGSLIQDAASRDLEVSGEVGGRGVSEGRRLARLLDGRFVSNTRFDDHAIVRRDVPPSVEVAGGAVMTILSPDEEGLSSLYHHWEEYLEDQGLAPLLGVRGLGPMEEGDALVPELVQWMMLRSKRGFEPTPRGREEDLTLSLDVLAEREFEEDTSVANGSSIAFLFEYAGRRLLLTGDAHPSVLVDGLRRLGYSEENPIQLDALKLAHHGSRANTSPELLRLLRCSRYLVSTSGARFDHPDMECLARIARANGDDPDTTFYFNYAGMPAELALAGGCQSNRYGYHLEHLGVGRALTLNEGAPADACEACQV